GPMTWLAYLAMLGAAASAAFLLAAAITLLHAAADCRRARRAGFAITTADHRRAERRLAGLCAKERDDD
ncbi:MAG: hypothetical protein ABJH61_12575, partial [Nitratireductor sp.]